MAIETKNTSGGELIFKQNGNEYVGQYYVQDGKIYAGNPNSGVTGANNGKNPKQQTELVRASKPSRDGSGFVNSPFGQKQNFSIKLQQDVYETVPEIIDSEVSELKPKKTDNLSAEQTLQQRIDRLFEEYSSLRDQVNNLGSERSHEFLVNSSLPYTDNFDSQTETVENLPTYNIEESTNLIDVQITLYPTLKGVDYYINNTDKFPFYYEEFDQRDPKGNPDDDGYHGISVIDADFWIDSGRQDIADYLIPKIVDATLGDIPLYNEELVGTPLPDDIILFEKRVVETREFIESADDSEAIETTFTDADFQPGSIKTTKQNLEIEQLLRERENEVDGAHIEFLQGEIDRLRALVSALEAQLEALGVQNGSLNEQLNTTLAQLQEELDDIEEDLVEDEGKGDILWSEPFEFGEEQVLEEKPFMKGWVSGSIDLVPTGGINGKGGVLVKRTATNWQSIHYTLYLQAYQTYTFTAYGRFGNLPNNGDLKIWIGDGRRPGSQPDYLSFKPFDWMYNWAADMSVTKATLEDSNGEWKFKGPLSPPQPVYRGTANRFRYGWTPVSGAFNPDGSVGGVYKADTQGKWYKIEFDFTPQPNSYHQKEFAGFGYDENKFTGGEYIKSQLYLYPGTYNSSPGVRGNIGDYVEWSDIKIYKRKNSNYRPFRDAPLASRLSMVNRPIDYDPDTGSDRDTLANRFYDSKELVNNRIYVFDKTYYRTYPELFTKSKYGVIFAFNPTTKKFESQGAVLSGDDNNANENQVASFDYGINLVTNANFSSGISTGWTYRGSDTRGGRYHRRYTEEIFDFYEYEEGDLIPNPEYTNPFAFPSPQPNIPYSNLSLNNRYGVKYSSGDVQNVVRTSGGNSLANHPVELGDGVGKGANGKYAFCFQEIDITGVVDGDYFKLSSWNGGNEADQNDMAYSYVKFYDENNKIIIPRYNNGNVVLNAATTIAFDSTTPINWKKENGDLLAVNIDGESDWDSSTNPPGYVAVSPNDSDQVKKTPEWGGFRTHRGWDRSDGEVKLQYSCVTGKVPPTAKKAIVSCFFRRTSGNVNNGRIDGVFFKITKTAPETSWELE